MSELLPELSASGCRWREPNNSQLTTPHPKRIPAIVALLAYRIWTASLTHKSPTSRESQPVSILYNASNHLPPSLPLTPTIRLPALVPKEPACRIYVMPARSRRSGHRDRVNMKDGWLEMSLVYQDPWRFAKETSRLLMSGTLSHSICAFFFVEASFV